MFYGKINVSGQWTGSKEYSQQHPDKRSIIVIGQNKEQAENLLDDAYGPYVSQREMSSVFFNEEPKDEIKAWLVSDNSLVKSKETALLVGANRLLKGTEIIAILVQVGPPDPLKTIVRVRSGEQIKHLALEDLGQVELFDLVEIVEELF